MKLSGTITKVSGPLVVANGLADANVSDVVRVGEQRLIGEILNMTGDSASIQVYEETSGLGPGAKVETTGMPLSVELGPGMLENIYDGIQRPLPEIRDLTGSNITRGIEVPALNRERVWHFDPVVQPGTAVSGGDVIGTVPETPVVLHKIMVPPDLKGTLNTVVEQLYGKGTKTRFRPHHFPFTEPSCEMDVQCHKCGGVGCPTCKGEGWIELLGAGMIHPKVLKMSGIDPEVYSGWAFGMGLERLAMRRFKISDLRLIFENDVRFLQQF